MVFWGEEMVDGSEGGGEERIIGLSISSSSVGRRVEILSSLPRRFVDEQEAWALRCRVSGKTRVVTAARVMRPRERMRGIHGLLTMSEPAMGPEIMRAVR